MIEEGKGGGKFVDGLGLRGVEGNEGREGYVYGRERTSLSAKGR